MNSFKKKLLPLFLVAVLLSSLFVFAEDKAKDPAAELKQEVAKQLMDLGFVKGDEKGDLGINENLTREQAAVIMSRLLGVEAEAEKFDKAPVFKDITVDYYKPFIAYAFEKGWMVGRSETTFGYGDVITIDEFYVLALRCLGFEGFKGEEFKKAGETAALNGLATEVKLKGSDKIDRGTAFIVMRNALNANIKSEKNVMSLGEQLLLKSKLSFGEKDIVIMHTNDMHGFFMESDDGMGLAKVARVKQLLKMSHPEVLYLEAGDSIQGSNLVTLSKGSAAIELLNKAGVDLSAVGNHEFDYGYPKLEEHKKAAKFKFLACNIKKADGTKPFEAYEIREVKGKKIAVIGVATPETVYKSHPDNTKGLTFEDPVKAVEKVMAELKGKADYFVVLAHLGDEVGEKDLTSRLLAEKIKDIDVIIDGHSHSTYEEGKVVNGVLIAQAGEKTKNVGIVVFKEDGSASAKLINKKDSALIGMDKEVNEAVNKVAEDNKKIEAEVIAKTSVELVGEREVVRKGESNLANLLTAALLDISKADFALTNGGGIRASIAAGDVTKGDILKAFPFGNTVRVVQIKGSDMKKALEHGLSKYPEANGGFPQIAGLTVKFNPKKEAGSRVTEVLVGGKTPIEDAKVYSVVTNDFLVAGGDGYNMLGGKVIAEFGAMDEVLINFIKTKGFDAAKTDGRITAVE